MFKNIEIREGTSSPLGLSIQKDGANFAVFSSHADAVSLLLFSPEKVDPEKEIPLKKTGDIWHVSIRNLPDEFDYSYRAAGINKPKEGFLFNRTAYLADPYARALRTPIHWGDRSPEVKKQHTRTCAGLHSPHFDWQNDTPPCIPKQDLIIYEVHLRGFTKDPSSSVKAPGTYLGMIEKIPYLKELGINAVELLPIFEFNETHPRNIQPKTGEYLPNYWGYDPLHYFSPMRRYASSSDKTWGPIEEFKTLVRELHKNGIEVILDVVYNHTGEEKDPNYLIHFRGLDNTVYYHTDSTGKYKDYTGCGNTVNCNHPLVEQFILDSLRYWVEEMHVDGFRFDLASILTRGMKGSPLAHPPILKAMSQDPVLSKVKWIAEAWDAVGLYQIGAFPNWGPWSEWNGKYRDTVRRFIKGTNKQAGDFATVLCGSESIYRRSKTPLSSINFITAHDGFSLRDLVTYQRKHNYENGEMNRDGNNQNDNWNCGAEGSSDDPQILSLRERQIRNFMLALFLSQGIPMIHMGDEYGHTRFGNNNPYVQDNRINWFLWNELEKNKKIFSFVSSLISFRKNHPALKRTTFLTNADVDWHGTTPHNPDWSASSRFVAYMLKSSPSLYIAFNANPKPLSLTLPSEHSWRQLVHTADDWVPLQLGPPLSSPFTLPPYSSLLAQEEKK